MLRPLNHPRNISAVKVESELWRETFLSCRQDGTGTQPWCWWQLSLLPSCSRKPAIIKQWFELAVVRSAFQFGWQWWQQLIEYKLVLPIKRTVLWSNPNCHRASIRVVASCRKAVASVQPYMHVWTHQVSTVSLHEWHTPDSTIYSLRSQQQVCMPYMTPFGAFDPPMHYSILYISLWKHWPLNCYPGCRQAEETVVMRR